MSLEDLESDVETAAAAINDEFVIDLDRETKQELAMLAAALEADPAELIRRAVHTLFRATVDSAQLDFHLRGAYDVTYEEYLAGMSYDEMAGGGTFPQPDDDRRYQF